MSRPLLNLINFLASEMSFGRISHIWIASVKIHFLLPVLEKPKIPALAAYATVLFAGSLVLMWFLYFTLFLLTSPQCQGLALLGQLVQQSSVLGMWRYCTPVWPQCWEVLPVPLPKTYQGPYFLATLHPFLTLHVAVSWRHSVCLRTPNVPLTSCRTERDRIASAFV